MGFIDFIFPKKCINCSRFGDFLCADCFVRISFNDSFLCCECLRPAINGMTHIGCMKRYSMDGVISAVVYNKISKKLIARLKYKPYLSRLSEIISEIMDEALAQNESFYDFISKYNPVIVPIPLSSERLRQRGYNHAEIIGSYVAKYFHLKLDSSLLIRIKNTKPQFKLSKKERFENIRNAFGIRENSEVPKSVILIDDVATTYATLKEAARVLKQAGSKRVLGVTFAQEL